MPIAHGEGNYWLPDDQLDALERHDQVVFRYAAPEGNPNGSARDIAGVIDEGGRVCGLMPHPERASDALLGLRRRHVAHALAGREHGAGVEAAA